MKNIIIGCTLSISTVFSAISQLQTPKASPAAKLEQKVGLTDIKIEYSRPSKNERTIFGNIVPFGEIWRTGANENTKFTTNDPIVFGKDTLKVGTYAIYTKPSKDSWDIIFYTESDNWGNPEKWDDTKVALTTKAKVTTLTSVVESFSISIENLETESASLNFTWDQTVASVSFKVPTGVKVMANIEKIMVGPSANDFYGAANYYYTEKKDLKQALTWVNKAIEIQGNEAFWMLRTKSLIQAELGDKKGAIETATISLKAAEKAGYKSYVVMNQASIEEWSKK
jgi:hypothetical protein